MTLFGDRYAFSEPIVTASGQVFRACEEPVTTATYCRFLNEIGHVEGGNGPELVNTVNYDALIQHRGGRWQPRKLGERRPVILLTYRGARLFADAVGLQLMDKEQWDAALAMDGPWLREAPSTTLNIEDVTDGPIEADKLVAGPSGIRGLLGNVGSWGRSVSARFAWSFGVGWNKSRLHLYGQAARCRWIRATSVSTGLRLVLPAGVRTADD